MPKSAIRHPTLLLLAGLILGSPIASACSNARTPPPPGDDAQADTVRLAIQPIPEIGRASYTGVDEPLRAIIRTESEWRELWGRLAAGTIPPPEPPAVDVERRMVIVATMGMKPTGGYAIEIEDVRATPDSLYITVIETSPGEGCITTQALTAPVAVVAVERHPGEPVFREREEIRDCG